MDASKLHVIAVISNPVRYKSRFRLYKEFAERMKCAGVTLWTVELAFGDRKFEITDAENPRHIRFRSFDELWHKENMINLAIARLPLDWEYVAWVDADILFHRPDWAMETLQQLQHYMVVQMFGHCIDLGPEGEPMQTHRGFVKGYFDEGFVMPNKFGSTYYYGGAKGSFAHTGYAWAARREAIEALGGLVDWAILGSGDHHMAMALIGEVKKTVPPGVHKTYLGKLQRWQQRALKYLHKDIGYVSGTISHFWHGKKKDRGYKSRWSILIETKYNPFLDLKRDSQGLWVLTDRNPRLRDYIRRYVRQRNEDSIDP